MERCIEDMHNAVARGRMTLDEIIRAYDVLDLMMETGTAEFPERFCVEYVALKDKLDKVIDLEALKQDADKVLAPLQDEMNEARFAAASAAGLHEFAKEVFEIWQTGGIFSRRRALRELRERAGFRLESHRIGNYVAKTFDLMNEAQARFARSQQALFAADVRYKIKPGIHKDIYRMCRACGSDLTITHENDKVV